MAASDRKTALLLVGGGVLAALAVAALAAKPAQAAPLPPMPPPPPPPPPPGTVAVPPGTVVVPPTISTTPDGRPLRKLGNPLDLYPNRYYRMRIELPSYWTALATGGDKFALPALQQLGFTDVRYLDNVSQLDPSWPPDAWAGLSPLTKWVEGWWRLPNATFLRPDWITNVWEQ